MTAEGERDKLLLAAKRIRRATSTEFVISLVADDFSRASSTYVGKLRQVSLLYMQILFSSILYISCWKLIRRSFARSNFLGTKFTTCDSQPPCDAATQQNSRSSRRFNSKQVSPRVPACNYNVGTVSYELNILRTRGPRRMQCAMHSIPVSSIQEGGTAPTPTLFPQVYDEQFSPSPSLKDKEPVTDLNSSPLLESPHVSDPGAEPLVLKNKSPRWHEQLQCWCLNFRGRVTVASVKNFQLVAAVDPSHNVSAEQQEKVILQFGKIGKDIFTMDYRYPLSCFQAFAICLSTFDTKPACEWNLTVEHDHRLLNLVIIFWTTCMVTVLHKSYSCLDHVLLTIVDMQSVDFSFRNFVLYNWNWIKKWNDCYLCIAWWILKWTQG